MAKWPDLTLMEWVISFWNRAGFKFSKVKNAPSWVLVHVKLTRLTCLADGSKQVGAGSNLPNLIGCHPYPGYVTKI